MTTTKDKPVFPVTVGVGSEYYFGLTKRELFATMAMQALCSNTNLRPNLELADIAVKLADELLTELSKDNK